MKRLFFLTPSGWAPILMSLTALAAIGVHLVQSGTPPQADEGTAAHIWQLLMVGQLPFVGWFMLRWIPERGRPALIVSAIQLGAMGAALFPVFWFNW